jgi:hypothetical protein
MIYRFTYTTIISGQLEVEIPDDTPMPELEAYRQARASQPFLRTAQLEMVHGEKKEPTDDNQSAHSTAP